MTVLRDCLLLAFIALVSVLTVVFMRASDVCTLAALAVMRFLERMWRN